MPPGPVGEAALVALPIAAVQSGAPLAPVFSAYQGAFAAIRIRRALHAMHFGDSARRWREVGAAFLTASQIRLTKRSRRRLGGAACLLASLWCASHEFTYFGIAPLLRNVMGALDCKPIVQLCTLTALATFHGTHGLYLE